MADFDLCVIGTGSGNSVVTKQFARQRVAIVESGAFGGTCLNVGCIPTKMYAYPADLARTPEQASGLGVDLDLRGARWEDIRDRIFARTDAVSADGREWREHRNAHVTLFTAEAHFVGDHALRVGERTITADRFVIAAGSRPSLPDVPGVELEGVHTSDTVMRVPQQPTSLAIVGGGYVAAEFAHIFASLGTQVAVICRSGLLLRREDAEIATRFTELMARQVDLRCGAELTCIDRVAEGLKVTVRNADGSTSSITVEAVLMATGRVPNADRLNLSATGVAVDDRGFVVVDDHQRTTADGIFALGDVCSPVMLKHVANHEARVVKHNLLHPEDMIRSDHRFIPHGVFSNPQVAAVGLTEEQARDDGVDYLVGRQDYGDTAYGWAMEDTEHFVKVLAERGSGRLLGAHLVGPQATSLIQPLIQAMCFGQTAEQVARGQYWVHPAMAEVVENALLELCR